jgi:hypothetical protein
MADELSALVGRKIYDLLLFALAERDAPTRVLPHPALRTSAAPA